MHLALISEQLRSDIPCTVKNTENANGSVCHLIKDEVVLDRDRPQSWSQFVTLTISQWHESQSFSLGNETLNKPVRRQIARMLTYVVGDADKIVMCRFGELNAVRHGPRLRENRARKSA